MSEVYYIGGYTNNINICVFENGEINCINKISGIKNPSYLNINKDFLYAVEELKEGKIVAYKIINNDLKFLNDTCINASLPCYITTDSNKKNLLVANYESGSMLAFEIEENGYIGKEKYRMEYAKNSNIHFAEFINGRIYVVDLGNDRIYVYNPDMELLNTIKLEKGLGPRHLVANNEGNIIYIVTEYSNQVLMYQEENKKFILKQKISTIKNKNIESYASAIKITKDNKYVYVTNRGENTIAVFENNEKRLKLIQIISSYGDYPRDIVLNKDEQYAIVVNQKSNNITTFKRNQSNGKLSVYKEKAIKIEKPSCIVGGKI